MAPRSYIQGPGALGRIGNHLKQFGIENPIVMASPSALKMGRDIIADSLTASGIRHQFIEGSSPPGILRPFAQLCQTQKNIFCDRLLFRG